MPTSLVYEIDLVLRDAAKFLLGFALNGHADRAEAARLAQALSNETGEGEQMERALLRLKKSTKKRT